MRDPRGVDQLPRSLFRRQSLGSQHHGTLPVPTTTHRSRAQGHHGAADRTQHPVRGVLPLVMDYVVGVLAAGVAVSAVSSCAIGSTSSRVPMLMEGMVNRTMPSIALPWMVPVSVNVVPDSATVTKSNRSASAADAGRETHRRRIHGRQCRATGARRNHLRSSEHERDPDQVRCRLCDFLGSPRQRGCRLGRRPSRAGLQWRLFLQFE
jgi:hypothetical protein